MLLYRKFTVNNDPYGSITDHVITERFNQFYWGICIVVGRILPVSFHQGGRPLSSNASRRSTRLDSSRQTQWRSRILRDRRADRSLFILVSVFLIFLLPYVIWVTASTEEMRIPTTLFQISFGLHWLSSPCNPFANLFIQIKYRRAYANLFHRFSHSSITAERRFQWLAQPAVEQSWIDMLQRQVLFFSSLTDQSPWVDEQWIITNAPKLSYFSPSLLGQIDIERREKEMNFSPQHTLVDKSNDSMELKTQSPSSLSSCPA